MDKTKTKALNNIKTIILHSKWRKILTFWKIKTWVDYFYSITSSKVKNIWCKTFNSTFEQNCTRYLLSVLPQDIKLAHFLHLWY